MTSETFLNGRVMLKAGDCRDERARESLKARGKTQGHDDLPLFQSRDDYDADKDVAPSQQLRHGLYAIRQDIDYGNQGGGGAKEHSDAERDGPRAWAGDGLLRERTQRAALPATGLAAR